MKPLELTVTEEQVKRFLKDQVGDFYDDMESPRNYLTYINQAVQKAIFLSHFKQQTEVSQYLQDLKLIKINLEFTLQGLNTPDPFGEQTSGDKNRNIDKHYQSLLKLVDTYNTGIGLDIFDDTIRDEVNQISELLKRQIFVVNTLYDPTKSNREFREKLRGDPVEFAKYVEEHIN